MVLPAPMPASCLKPICSSAERLAFFWHLKDGVKLHVVASQVPSRTCGGSCPSSGCPQMWILMNTERMQLEFTGCRVLTASFSRTPTLPEGQCRHIAPETQTSCCPGWPLACEDGSSKCLFFCCCLTQEQTPKLQAQLCEARGRSDAPGYLEFNIPLPPPKHVEWLKVRKTINT